MDQRPSEMYQILTELSEVVNCLFRLSMSVRNPTGTQRYIKSAHIDISYYERYDVEYVEQKFPSAKKYLVERLGKAISRRRQYLKYRDMHAAKIAQRLDEEDTATARSETTATVLFDHSGRLEDSMSVASESSYATSVGSVQRARMPSMPKKARGGLPFECPYCRTIECVKDTHAWMKHVHKDLQPYMCTFENCATPNEMYDGRRQWFNHELQKHRRSWTCHGHCNQTFTSDDELAKHIRKYFPGHYSDAQIPVLAEMWAGQMDRHAESSCPLCGDRVAGSVQMQKHLGRHLEEVALFALPSADTNPDSEYDNEKSSQVGQEASPPPTNMGIGFYNTVYNKLAEKLIHEAKLDVLMRHFEYRVSPESPSEGSPHGSSEDLRRHNTLLSPVAETDDEEHRVVSTEGRGNTRGETDEYG